jgi:hypothetical protein
VRRYEFELPAELSEFTAFVWLLCRFGLLCAVSWRWWELAVGEDRWVPLPDGERRSFASIVASGLA